MTGDFTVNPRDLEKIGKQVCDAAADLRSVRTSWDGRTREGSNFFGTTESASAFQSLQDTTFASLGKHVDHLGNLADSVASCARTYDGTDRSGARSFRGGN